MRKQATQAALEGEAIAARAYAEEHTLRLKAEIKVSKRFCSDILGQAQQ